MINKLPVILQEEHTQQIKEVMRLQGISQQDLKEMLGAKQSGLSQVLNGKNTLRQDFALKIYEALGKPQSLSFLETYVEEQEVGNKYWYDALYSLVKPLADAYVKASPARRQDMLHDLGKIVREYEVEEEE
tara:strand:- start:3226 stop:3618 length:393 start_codon:yes stop_codon:yes gene_type:complete